MLISQITGLYKALFDIFKHFLIYCNRLAPHRLLDVLKLFLLPGSDVDGHSSLKHLVISHLLFGCQICFDITILAVGNLFPGDGLSHLCLKVLYLVLKRLLT